ncbi:tetraspanin family protein [Necator americanus]|uniref:Tetraspanin family protein n=1 Tax=Necator americanus TaxID=51031 RepID=W2SP65_NECAM|nr:tetraspanin family protein [Necator americanus]ETN71435.1 tetraspanin family protein [Necator americanus]
MYIVSYSDEMFETLRFPEFFDARAVTFHSSFYEMPLSCTARALKFSLFVFNLVFLLCGLICVGIGTWLVLDKYAIDNLALATAQIQGYEQETALRDLATKPTAVRQIGYLLLLGGLLVIFVAFLGCCGAAKEWRPLLCCYATCLMVILATEIAAAIYAAMHSHMFEDDFREILRASLRLYNGTDNARKKNVDGMLMKAAWDKLMVEGCYAKIAESFQELTSHFKVVSWTVVLIALIQVVSSSTVFGIIVGFWLCDSITSEDDLF